LQETPALLDSVLVFLDRGLLDAAGWQVVAYTLVATHLTIVALRLRSDAA